jgi:diaminopimelate epimerase
MITRIEFTKMHGAANDYIYVNTAIYDIKDPEKTAIAWSNRHTGIGGDGLVLIGPSEIADFRMRIFNADGSEAMMCGNATRCVAKYVYEKGLTDKREIALETLSGIKILKLHVTGATVESVTVDMGMPGDIKEIDLGEAYKLKGTTVNMGNPHLVIFTDDVTAVELPVIGPKLENHPLFPGRVNVEFAQSAGKNKMRMRVWERGSGITMACGTGACATAVAAITKGFTDRKVDVVMDGGTLTIEWEEKTGHILMTGPAEIAFEGYIEI